MLRVLFEFFGKIISFSHFVSKLVLEQIRGKGVDLSILPITEHSIPSDGAAFAGVVK
jgi:hypothetical protein